MDPGMQDLCRDTRGNIPVMYFSLYTCSMCYNYLFRSDSHLTPQPRTPWNLIPKPGSDAYPQNLTIEADVKNVTSRNLICRTLNDENCSRWTDCCLAAIDCCKRQLSTPKRNYSTGAYCPRTWDGFGCFDDAPAGSRSLISCPSYVVHASSDNTAFKDCTENGTWWILPSTNSEWTNYSTCLQQLDDFKTMIYIGLACNIFSLVLLIPSCAIFLGIRQLRVQKRIKLHVCLFMSFIVLAIVRILWDFIVFMDRMEKKHMPSETVMHRNSGGCKFLYLFIRYATNTNFFWMFCEGFYLHRLIVHAFSVPKTLIPYYIFGWLISWIPCIIYAIIRATNPLYDKSCWVQEIGNFEWIIYTPNLLCIGANLIFLGNILRILCSKLQAHPNEPSNYRKALKATFVLIPLFGLQQFVVIYRPPPDSQYIYAFEIIQTVIKNTQGAAVALLFCFLNGEVHGHLKSYLFRHVKPGTGMDYFRKSSMSSATQFTSMVSSTRRGTRQYENSDRGYIPLSTSTTTTSVANADITPTNGHVSFAL